MSVQIKRVLAISDICSFGKCSLGVTVPIISSMGIEVCMFPTALFSSYLLYKNAYKIDLTEHMAAFINHFSSLNFHVNALYSGFLGSIEQIRIVKDCIRELKPKFVLVDPVLGDNGKFYSGCNEQMMREMKNLLSIADIVTPNLTEACLLTGIDENEPERMARQIFEQGAKAVVITGIRREEFVCNAIYDVNGYREQSTRFIKMNKSGTGDLFASVLLGKLMNGESIDSAVRLAAEFLGLVLKNQEEFCGLAENSVFFEPFLKEL